MKPMTAELAIKREILTNIRTQMPHEFPDLDVADLNTAADVAEAWNAMVEGEGCDCISDSMEEFRQGQYETKLPSDGSRYYESKAVAAKMSDGAWVGWTYWYGGGKHGDPGGIDWMEDAYFLTVTEEEKLVTVRTFRMRETTDG